MDHYIDQEEELTPSAKLTNMIVDESPKFSPELAQEAYVLLVSHVSLRSMVAFILQEAYDLTARMASTDYSGPDGHYRMGQDQGAIKGRQDVVGRLISMLTDEVPETPVPEQVKRARTKRDRTSQTRKPIRRSRPTAKKAKRK